MALLVRRCALDHDAAVPRLRPKHRAVLSVETLGDAFEECQIGGTRLDDLDEVASRAFDGFIVRKDLARDNFYGIVLTARDDEGLEVAVRLLKDALAAT